MLVIFISETRGSWTERFLKIKYEFQKKNKKIKNIKKMWKKGMLKNVKNALNMK